MFVIKTPTSFVHSFNEEHQVVTVTEKQENARLYLREHHAQKFLDTMSDCDYGLNSDTAVVLPYTGPTP